MLHKNPSTSNRQWKYMLLLPLLALFIGLFNTKTIAQTKKLTEVVEINKLEVNLIIDKNATDASLKKESTFFKDEFDIVLSFKGIKRNSEKEITAIKIDAKGKSLKAKFETSGEEAIHPIKISYDSENNALSIGTVHEKMHKHKLHKDKHGKVIIDKDINVTVKKDGKGNTFIIKESADDDHEVHTNIEWIEKHDDGDHHVKTEKIIIESSDGKHKAWTHKHDKDKDHKNLIKIKEVKVTSDGDLIHIEETEKGAHDENVFIIKGDSNKHKIEVISSKEKGSNVFISGDMDGALYLINGKEASSKEFKALSPDIIDSINVYKGEAAIAKYGKKAKNGVIAIQTKKIKK